MRFKSGAILGVAVALSTLTGCSVVRHDSNESFNWQQASDNNKEQPYSIAPNHPQMAGRFDFSHPRVGDFVYKYQTDLRGFYGRALERSGRYVPRISPILKKEGVPEELAYLPLVESGFQPRAISHSHAVGLWQFIPDTGRRYGLRIDKFVDERRDPVKSTHAAARYLKDLYQMFGDWHLSLAAYNTGEHRISGILERGTAENFWAMSEQGYLYRETEDYVPGFLAALQIAAQPEAYGFEPSTAAPPRYDLVHVGRSCPLSKVAELCGASTEEIKDLNPALHRGLVPPNGYSVRVPKGSKQTFQVAYGNLSSSDWAAIDRSMQPKRPAKVCSQHHGRMVCKTVKAKGGRAKAANKKNLKGLKGKSHKRSLVVMKDTPKKTAKARNNT
ncbi:MAG TPA: transglycosylase SLT domain-containing protein, partial [Candidatus Acidoferrales bacterium]|nr:transglycosylase SLT domain-containing protein [Candidatus Acidoferrales bacterium]